MGSVTKTLSTDEPTIRAQVLDPNRWLIPQQHPDIPRFTAGNRVDPLIDGETAFQAMHEAFIATADDGYIYITGWDMVPDIHLLKRSSGPASQIQTVLGGARRRGVDVRILLWHGNAITIPGRPHRGGLGQAVWEGFPWANIFTDNKTRGPGSHHQKTAAVRTSKELISFIGGIDLTADRWDTHAHRFRDPDADYEVPGGQPWHDVQARIRGPAAADVETNFRHRWNDTRIVRPSPLPPVTFPSPTPPAPTHPRPGPVAGGTHIVQMLRTFPRAATALGVDWPYDFAPTGELGHLRAYLNAIGNARDYIYIEDQYMISDDIISPAIAAAMRRSAHLQVVLVTAPQPDTPPRDAFDFHQNAFLARLRAVDPTRVQIFDLLNGTGTGIYCHAKVCIIDDIWAIIGSCNMSTRSLTHDSEIGIVVLDETIERGRRKFARDLRIDLWAEHLGLTPGERRLIDDPLTGVAEWRARAGTSPGHAGIHVRPAGSDSFFWRRLVDPDGR
jgi:phosphatidylserine/phosphatidylglycerophosphate/cardiolipin synthase-like enzyme